MRLAELSDTTGVAVATLKYYLREGLLHPGRAVSRTQSDYDETHVERVRLVRALSEVGGLSLATIGRVLDVITSPGQDWITVLSTAQRSLVGGREARVVDNLGRASAWVTARGWHVDPEDPFIDDLDRAWAACDDVGLGLDEERMNAYADHVEGVAEIDVRTVPADPEGAIRQVILGTVLVDPVLAALRRLAQQHVSMGRAAQR
ncbi:putative transcriptional regulator [Janibacter sp. HTCC2649]|uniref:MerR family transcriptional regulator n=1 Tax=Janibacter sp. HTCC2649 TaxID=313589 RepID=UPI0000671A78|nr:MerR family transcriptional regulator [Janibacter sp. HTCC2649]EAP97916.1 putative transcriptional regulator [Janibacter sp. HTCC2649]